MRMRSSWTTTNIGRFSTSASCVALRLRMSLPAIRTSQSSYFLMPSRPLRAAAVERGAIGAAAAFDGNYTDDVVSWMFFNEHWRDEDVPDLLDQLMGHTEWGHLSWVVFPPYGYRL